MTIEHRRKTIGWRTCLSALLCLAAVGMVKAQTTEVVLHNFCASKTCPSTPYAGVIGDSSGNLYGTTFNGGAHGRGTVYKLDTSRKLSVLYSFCAVRALLYCADGKQPSSGVIRDAAGNLYGTTEGGGASNYGVVYKLDSSGVETVLYSFCALPNCVDGQIPDAGVIRDSAGNLYGTTEGGGAYGSGVVYKLDPSGIETVLYSFCALPNCADGEIPSWGVILDSAGNLYGTTNIGGAYGNGVVYELDPSGIETVLYSFCALPNCADGEVPSSGVIRDAAGDLYGVTDHGGAADSGTVYKLDPSGVETVLYSFCALPGCADGQYPNPGVIRDSAGSLYGTTSNGGTNGGVVYKLDSSGVETVLYSLCTQTNCADGQSPEAGVIRDSAGNLYGTTYQGGSQGVGVVFKLKP